MPPITFVLAGSGCVTGEASTWPRWVHLLPSLAGDAEGADCCHRERADRCEGFLFGAIWKTMGEHLVPQGYWHLSAPVHWHKRQHVINFIISPGFVSLGASIFFISFNSVQAGLNRRVCISLPLASSMVYFCLLLMFHWSASSEAPTPPSCWYHYSSYDCLCFSLSLYVIFCAPNASEHRSVH